MKIKNFFSEVVAVLTGGTPTYLLYMHTAINKIKFVYYTINYLLKNIHYSGGFL